MALEDISGSLGAVVRRAIVAARARLGDPLGRVAVVCTSQTTADQLSRDLSCGPGLLNVVFVTPGQLIAAMGQPALAGQTPEPPGWMSALLSSLLSSLDLGRYTETLRQPGWRGPLAAALRELDAAGVTDDDLREATGSDPDLQERAGILLALRAAVADARAAEGRYTQRALELAARDCARARRPHPYDDVQVAILAGDAMLSTAAHEALSAWLAGRSVLRLALPPLDTLPPAPSGLWLAAPDAAEIPVEPPATALGHLRRHAFTPPTAPGPADDTVVFAATPDEVREIGAAVEEVMAAIRAGTPLEKIAIVLPDPSQAGVLSDALAAAGIPATWLTAEPLRQTLPAGFLLLALQLAEGDASPQRWHQLLTHPGLLGLEWTGRLRWRRLLSGLAPSPSADSTDDLLAHLKGEAEAAAPEEDGTPSRARAAAEALASNIERLQAALVTLPKVGTLADHGAAWSALLGQFYRRGRAQARILRMMQGWGGGARLGRSAAAALLEDQLRSTPNLRGSLTQRAVRVLPPMLALGGDYALVCLTGVVDGRLPRRIEEGGLLNAPLRAALRAQGRPIVTRAEREAVEQRRLGAVLAGCRGKLWLSSPQTELLEARPTLPGALLLQLGSALAGERLSLKAMRSRMVRCGRRSAPAPRPERAIGAAGSRLARAAHAPQAHLDELLRHPSLRRLATMHRAIDRLLYADGPPTVWTGLIDPGLLPAPALQGTPQHPRALTDLVHAPSAYFLHELLGGRSPARLRGGGLSPGDVRRAVLAVLERAGEGQFAHAWNTQVEAWGAQGALSPDARAALLARGLRHVAVLRRGGVAGGLPLPAVEGAAVGPFTVTTDGAVQQGDAMLYRRSYVSSGALKATDPDGFRLLAEAFALQSAGLPIQKVRRVGLNGTRREDGLDAHRAAFQDTAHAAAARAAAGFWPTTTGNNDRLAFARERTDGPRLPAELLLSRLPPGESA